MFLYRQLGSIIITAVMDSHTISILHKNILCRDNFPFIFVIVSTGCEETCQWECY